MATETNNGTGTVIAWLVVLVILAAVAVGFLLQGLFGLTVVMMATVPVIYLTLIALTAGKI